MTQPQNLLEVRDLTIAFPDGDDWAVVVDQASFDVARGETVGLVGESGSGKTVSALAIMGLMESHGGRILGGSVCFEGEELVGLNRSRLSTLRGARLSMIFQQPTRCLNPAFTVGDQIAESIRRHRRCSRRQAWSQAVMGLERVGIPNAAARASSYPHQFSGGMCQRVMIAMALACSPSLLIADEPTTALDVTVQSQILELLDQIRLDEDLAVLFISHDLSVIAEICDRVVVMYAGQVVETAAIERLYVRPQHPYTSGLLNSIPRASSQKRLVSIEGNVPDVGALPTGCRFHPRCPYCDPARCTTEDVTLDIDVDHGVRCVRHEELALPGVVMP